MPFFRCVSVDEFGHTIFAADITADNRETAKRHAFVILENPALDARPPLQSIEIW